MAETIAEGIICPRCGSKKVKQEERLASPNAVGSIGSWRVGWGYGVAIAVLLFGVLALYVRRFVDPTLDTLFLAIALVSFIYALYVLAGSLYAARWAHVKKYVCQKCLHEWLPVSEATQ